MYVLSKVLGESPQIKIAEVFAEHYEDELSAPDIARMTDVSKATVYDYIKGLLKEGVIKKTRRVGKTQLYQLNYQNIKAKTILLLENYLVKEGLKKRIMAEEKLMPKETSTFEIDFTYSTDVVGELVGKPYPTLHELVATSTSTCTKKRPTSIPTPIQPMYLTQEFPTGERLADIYCNTKI